MNKKAIVIGSGLGGIASAIRLRAKNYDVTLIEKNSDLGGRARTFYKNGYTFDAGPTVITAPYLIEELFSLFKKDYINYLLSIILPAVISGLSIPVFKHLLGAEGYGLFSIWLNAVLIGTAVLSAWITQSVIRFYPSASNKLAFSKKAIRLSLYTQALFFIPTFLMAWYASDDVLLAVLCSLLLFAVSIQFTLLPIIQSGFLSKKIIWSEFIRIVSYVLLALVLLKLTHVEYIYALYHI